MKELTVLMPCLNEEDTIEKCIIRAQKLLSKQNIDGEILISDNGSTDKSIELALKLGARIVHCPTIGYGAALQYGIENAEGKFILMGDSDDSYHFDEAMPLIERLRAGYDVCMGTRLKGKIVKSAMPPLHRYLGNPLLTWIGKILYKIELSDFHCGMRAFVKEKIIDLNLVTTGMEWASEMIIKSQLAGLRMTEVPITLYKDGRSKPPHLKSWRDGWRHLRFMLIHSPKWLFIIPGIIMALVGLMGEIILSISPIKIGKITLDVHSLLVMSFVLLIGIQTIFTGVFAKLYGQISGLLPIDEKFYKILEKISLERLLVISILIGICGFAGFFYTFYSWYKIDFSNLNYQVTLRELIPSLNLIAISIQSIFNSFMISTLFLKPIEKRN